MCVCTALWWPYADGRSSYAEHELHRDIAVVRQMAAYPYVTLGPISSLGGFHFGPAYYFIIYPFVRLFAYAPWSLAVSSLVFQLATLLLAGGLVRRWFRSESLAMTVMVAIGASNIMLQLAKYGSNPNYVPFFSLCFFWALERLMAGERRLVQLLTLGYSAGVLVQLHAVPMLAFPVILVAAMALRWLRFTWRTFAVAFGAGVLTVSPWLLPDAMSGFGNIRQLFGLARGDGGLHIGTRALDLVTMWLTPVLSTHSFFNVTSHWSGGLLIAVALLSLGVLWAVRADRLKRFAAQPAHPPVSRSVRRMLLLWLIVPNAVLLLPFGGSVNLQIYYFACLLPLAIAGYAYAMHRLWFAGWRRTAVALAASFFVAQAAQLVLYHRLMNSLL